MMSSSFFRAVALLGGVGAGLACAEAPARAAAASANLALRCGAAWDARHGRWPGPVLIVVQDGRIAMVRPAAGPVGVGETDLTSATCLPGLIDAHTHVLLQGDVAPGEYDDQLLKQSNEYRTIVATLHVRRMLSWGFTSIRDLGSEGAGYADVDVKNAIDRGLILGPRMQVAGRALAATGAYPLLGYAPATVTPKGVQEVDGAIAGRKAVREQISYGAGLIKLYADRSPRASAGDVLDGIATFTPEELSAMIDEAHRQGVKVAVHARAWQGAHNAIEAGADSIEHGDYIADADLQAMARRGTYLVPTIDTDPSIGEARAKAGSEVWAHIRGIKAKTFGRALKAKVKIAFGTDIGGFSWEYNPAGSFRWMVQWGMTPEQVLTSATQTAAELMGVSGEVGTLDPGKQADIIAVRGDPLTDVRRLEAVVYVTKGGVAYPTARAGVEPAN